jgi:hypothetical protein
LLNGQSHVGGGAHCDASINPAVVDCMVKPPSFSEYCSVVVVQKVIEIKDNKSDHDV